LKPVAGIRLNTESAEPSTFGAFLVEWYKETRDRRFLAAAEKAAGYLVREIAPKNKWFDFETFLSCSPKPYEFLRFDNVQPNRATQTL